MSYTRHFSSSVTVSGSKTATYNYPASEHGGSGSVTVYYDETVPINMNIHVETDPFDRSVDSANAYVDALTGAVAAMNAAQCASVRKSGENISAAISKGFYRLIGSELTTQMSENKSLLQAKIALVMELAKDIASKHSRMQDDLARLKKQYSQTFANIDEDCEKRVLALDKKAFDLSNVRNKLLTVPYFKEGAFSLQETVDTSNSQNLLSIARLRNKAANVINVMAASALNSKKYKHDVETLSESIAVAQKDVSYIPVVFAEQKSFDQKDNMQLDSFCTDGVNSKEQIQQGVSSFVSGTQAEQWKDFSKLEMQMIEQSFVSLVEQDLNSSNSESKQRVFDEIMRLWKSNSAKTLNQTY